jgi:hypothetical protein
VEVKVTVTVKVMQVEAYVPAVWVEVEAYGALYYWNVESDEVQFEKPKKFTTYKAFVGNAPDGPGPGTSHSHWRKVEAYGHEYYWDMSRNIVQLNEPIAYTRDEEAKAESKAKANRLAEKADILQHAKVGPEVGEQLPQVPRRKKAARKSAADKLNVVGNAVLHRELHLRNKDRVELLRKLYQERYVLHRLRTASQQHPITVAFAGSSRTKKISCSNSSQSSCVSWNTP